ncbi:MAG: HAD-IIIA family hydrolase [Phycisphaerae bacterium]
MTRAAVFLDRDGTIIEDVGYLRSPDQVKLLPGAAEAIRRLAATGRLVVIVSNQSGVARGLFDEFTLSKVHERLEALLGEFGARLSAAYYCPYLAGEGAKVAAYRRASELRKPKPGMLLQAARELDIDLSRSWMIGDSPSDIEAGRQAGCRTIRIYSNGTGSRDAEAGPTYTAVSLLEAAKIVERDDTTHGKEKVTVAGAAAKEAGTKPRGSAASGSDAPVRPAATGRATARTLKARTARDPVKRESAMESARAPGNLGSDDPLAGSVTDTVPPRIGSIPRGPPGSTPSRSDRSNDDETVLDALRRISKQIDRAQRGQRQQDFSILRLCAALCQMSCFAAALWGAAALFDDRSAEATARLVLAVFLQLTALSLFAVDRFR